MTEDNVYRVEHKLISETVLWESMESDRDCHTVLAYICGINEMAAAVVDCLKELG